MRALRWTAITLAALLLAAAATLAGLWTWSASEGSLTTAADWAQRWLPRVLTDGQTLVLQDVQGVLREGGTIGHLQWQHGAQKVELQGLQIAWDWRALQSGRLHLPMFKARLLRYEDTGASAPLVQLHLPLPVDVVVDIATVELPGPPLLDLQGLQGHYVYDGTTHKWDVTHVQIAAGTYSAKGTLQAAAPMAINTLLQGAVQVDVPGSQSRVDLQATVQVKGTLSAPDGVLDIAADLQSSSGAQAKQTTKAKQLMQATAQAQIKPWQAQPVVSAQAQYQGLNLAALWPQAPMTALTGRIQVLPQGEGWLANAKTTNAQSGPWDTGRVPVQSLDAAVLYRSGQWVVQSLQATLAGGTLQAQGQFSGKPAVWSLKASLQGIHPEQLDTRLAADVLGGQASAQQAGKAIEFALALKGNGATRENGMDGNQSAAMTADTPLRARLKSLDAKGGWTAPQLQLDELLVQAQNATLQGQVTVNTATWESKGRLQANVPGAQAVLDGTLGITKGEGSLKVSASDTDALLRWLARLPLQGVAQANARRVQGGLDLAAHWKGGWQKQGAEMAVDATLQSERLLVGGTVAGNAPSASAGSADAAAALRLSGLRATALGTLHAMQLTLLGQADTATQTLNLQSQWHGGLVKGSPVNEGEWAASLDTLQLALKDAQRTGIWNAQLVQSVALKFASGKDGRALDIAPGTLRLTGPLPGAAQIDWQAAHWSHKAPGVPHWQTQGRITGLPLPWFELLGQTQLANLGLRGDLVFGGAWDATMGEHLRLRAALERTAGDLQMLSQDQTSTLLNAGLRDTRVLLQIDDEAVIMKLGWNSDGAGNASAEFHTRLQNSGGWSWPADAPVSATIRTSLPRVGVWSLLAPPGWRIQGTLDSNMALSGTRANPDWSGTIEARDMAIRSVVDGIDFSKGVLRVKLDGQRMEISEFTLQGAGAAASGDTGGTLQATGQVLWLTPAESATPGRLASRVRLELDAVAQQLRVSARADQRLVVSGRLSAKLDEARLTLRGALVADQAEFVLPDDTAPQLGADVVVRPSANRKAARSTSGATAPATDKPRAVALDVDVTLDPGKKFHLKGQGIDTRLEGKLTMRTEGKASGGPRLTGELRTVGGSYKAYGQTLDIETGVLRFNGPYDNPALDILALRPNLQQTVGVQISGTARLPVVRLYSDPDMADAEKLSWLVLGRASSTSGSDYALLQSAAMALMAGRGEGPTSGLIKAFGLDEVSLGEAATTNPDGSAGTAATTVKVGKRLSRDFYVAYERSIATTLGTFYVFYDLSRRFTLRAESGSTSAIDLIFTTRFD
jgi:translocation and assembly module TamB